MKKFDPQANNTKANATQRDGLQIPRADWPDEGKVIEAVTRQIEAMLAVEDETGGEMAGGAGPEVAKGLADIATNAWRARNKMIETATGEVREEMKRVYRHIEAILQNIQDMGVEIKDHTGSPFDYGLPLKVVATQPTERLGRETIVETIKPTVYWNDQIIQMGEVVIATPASPRTKP
jgi:hypothetical protein